MFRLTSPPDGVKPVRRLAAIPAALVNSASSSTSAAIGPSVHTTGASANGPSAFENSASQVGPENQIWIHHGIIPRRK